MFGKKKKKKRQFETVTVGEYSIRAATLGDTKEVRRLVLEAAKNEPSLVGLSYTELKKADDAFWDEWVKSFLENSRSFFGLVFYQEKTSVGFLMVEAEAEVRFSHTAILTPMYIQKAHRDEQIEQKLLDGVLMHLHDSSDVKKIRMCLTPENASEFPLYGGAGFVRFGFDEQHLKVGKKFYDCVLLVKSF